MARLWTPKIVPPATGASGEISSTLFSYSSKERRRIKGCCSPGSALLRPGFESVRLCDGLRLRLGGAPPFDAVESSLRSCTCINKSHMSTLLDLTSIMIAKGAHIAGDIQALGRSH